MNPLAELRFLTDKCEELKKENQALCELAREAREIFEDDHANIGRDIDKWLEKARKVMGE